MTDRVSSKEITVRDDQSNDAADLIEITGVIKWFDVAKGFGFIVPDNGMQDVLLHVTCLRRDGYQTVLEGTRVVALIHKRDRGYQAFRILSMDQSTAVHPSQMPAVKNDAIVFLDGNGPMGTAANPTPLAISWVLDDYVAQLAEAAGAGK